MNQADYIRPPEEGTLRRYATTTTTKTVAIPDALKNRFVTIYVYDADAYWLLGRGTTASELAVNRASAPTDGVATNVLGLRLQSSNPNGYPFYIDEYFNLMALDASSSGYVIFVPSGAQTQPPSDRSDVT